MPPALTFFSPHGISVTSQPGSPLMQTRSLILQTQPTIDFRDSTLISLETLISGSPDDSRIDILLSSLTTRCVNFQLLMYFAILTLAYHLQTTEVMLFTTTYRFFL